MNQKDHGSTRARFKHDRVVLIGGLIVGIVSLLVMALSMTQTVTAVSPDTHEMLGESGLYGVKWNDLDGDGVYDENEPTIPDWTIWLEGTGLVMSTTTNPNGVYSFIGLPEGEYAIGEEMVEGWVQTYPPEGYHEVFFHPEQPIDGLNFGNHQGDGTGSIYGMKWNDLNGDGHKDPDEPGLEGWEIALKSGFAYSETVTDENGNYWFENLPPGQHYLFEIQQEGWVQTFPEENFHFVQLSPGETVEGVDFGNWEPDPGEIHGTKWHDENGNGVWDDGEDPLSGWTIQLLNDNGVVDQMMTDVNGQYWFTDVVPSHYFVVELMQDGWQQTYPEDGFHHIDLESGQVVDGLDFGNWEPEPGSIHGAKWHDENSNGVWDDGEVGLSGWTIVIEGAGYYSETTTNGDGEYWFMGLLPGEYYVEEVQESGWQQTFPADFYHVVQLEAGQVIEDIDFGNWEPETGEIHGIKFEDLNGNGVQDDDEPPLDGWTILLQDAQGDVIKTETNEDGEYWFMGVLPGEYHLTELFTPWSDWTQSAPTGTHHISLAPSEIVDGVDFGNWQEGKEDFCIMPWDNHFIYPTFIDTQVYIFNASDMPEKGYTVHMVGLPAGTASPSDVDGSGVYEILSPLPISLNPNEFGLVDIRAHYLPAFAAGATNRAVMQAVVTNLDTGESFGCHAALWPVLDWWTQPTVHSGIGGVPFGFTLATGFTVTNNTPIAPPTFNFAPVTHEDTVSYTVMAMTPGRESDPIISLNGLLPGEMVVGEIALEPGETAVVMVDIEFTEHLPGVASDILFELDIDQDGVIDSVTSLLVESVKYEIRMPVILR